MYELIQISDCSYYIQSPAKIGLVKLDDTNVCLIVRKAIDKKKITAYN